MFIRCFTAITLCIFMVIGCGRFDTDYTAIISSDEVSNIRVSCVKFLGVPTMCAIIDETTKTIRIEHVVTEIVNRVVEKEVVTEVPIEKIVTRVETQYIGIGKEVDIEEIVKYVIARIKEYVPPTDIIRVPTSAIVEETTEDIINAPPSNLGPNVPLATIKRSSIESVSSPDNNIGVSLDPDADGDTTIVRALASDNTDVSPQLGNDTEKTRVQGESGDATAASIGTNVDTNDGDSSENARAEVVANIRLRVQIGPKAMTSPPFITQPGLNISVACQIDGDTVHPGLNSYSIFRGDNRKQWGVEVWCEVPSDVNASDVTIHVYVNDFRQWCGLTATDVKVSRFTQDTGHTVHGGHDMAALIRLNPDPVPECVTTEEIQNPPDPITPDPEYLQQEEFFEVYYAILLDSGFLEVQCYTIRGYGYDDGTPIYVDNYHKFEGGSSDQTLTEAIAARNAIISHRENGWDSDYPEVFGYVHSYTKVSADDGAAIYQTIYNAADAMGTWEDFQVGLSYPEVANNTSDDVLNLETLISTFEN